jgi:hypothetical protein
MLRVVSHDRPIALANTSSDCELASRMSCSIGRFDISDNAATVSSKRPFEANSCSLPAVRRPRAMYRFQENLRGRVTQRLSCDGSLDAACDFVDDTVNLGFCVFAFRLERGAHLRRRCCEQAVK